MEKGMILVSVRKVDLARAAFDDSIRVKPTVKALTARANLNFAQGQILGNKGDWDGAAPFFKSAQADSEMGIELDPTSYRAAYIEMLKGVRSAVDEIVSHTSRS